MDLKEALTLLVDESRLLCGSYDEGCPRCQAAALVIKQYGLDESSLTPYPEGD